MEERSKLFVNLENQFKNSNYEEIKERTKENFTYLVSILSQELDMNTVFGVVIHAAQIGLACDTGIGNEKEVGLIHYVFNIILKNVEKYVPLVCTNEYEGAYSMLDGISGAGNEVAITFLEVLLGFAYVDGNVNEDVLDLVDKKLGNCLKELQKEGMLLESVPTVRILNLENELYNWFKKNDACATLEMIMEEFSENNEKVVQAACDDLCRKGALYFMDTFGGKMYGNM